MAEEAALLPGHAGRADPEGRLAGARSTATACCCASSRLPAARCSSSRAPSIRRWRDSSIKACSDAEWGTSDNNRRAKFYRLTAAGRRRLKTETERWDRLAIAMSRALRAEGV